MSDFPEWLKGELDKQELPRSDLAQRAGVTPSYITHLIIGRQLPRPDLCRRISDILEVPQEFVFRQAGILSPLPFASSDYTEWIKLFSQLSEDNKLEMIEFAKIKLQHIEK